MESLFPLYRLSSAEFQDLKSNTRLTVIQEDGLDTIVLKEEQHVAKVMPVNLNIKFRVSTEYLV